MKIPILPAIKRFYLLVFYFLSAATAAVPVWAAEFTRACPKLDDYMKDGTGDNFLLKGAYETIAKVCSEVAALSWAAFAGSLQGVVAIGASIYIALYTLKNIGAFSQQDPAAYLSNEKTGVIPLGVKTGIVIWLLSDAGQSFLYGNLIGPVITAGFDVASSLGIGSSLSSSFSNAGNVSGLFSDVIQRIVLFNDAIYEVVATGRLLLCLAFLPDSVLDWFFSLIPFGTTLYVFGWLILIGASFYLLDVLFRLAVGCIILPLAIACGMSKLTSPYTRKAWNLFINVCFNFMMFGVIICLIQKMLEVAIAGNGNMMDTLNGDFKTVDDIENKIKKNLSDVGFIMVTIACTVGFKVFSEVEKIADQVSSSSSVGKLGQKVGGTVASKAKAVAGNVTGSLGKAAGQAAMDSKAGRAVRNAASDVHNGAKKAAKKLFGIR